MRTNLKALAMGMLTATFALIDGGIAWAQTSSQIEIQTSQDNIFYGIEYFGDSIYDNDNIDDVITFFNDNPTSAEATEGLFPYAYHVVSFTPNVSGSYLMSIQSSPQDVLIYFYQNGFNATDFKAGFVSGNDDYDTGFGSLDSGARTTFEALNPTPECDGEIDLCPATYVTLNSGQCYSLVVSTYDTSTSLATPLNVSVNGPGALSISDGNCDIINGASILSPASEFEANRRAIEDVLYGEMSRSVQSSLSTSTRMVREARGRLIDAQGCGGFGSDTSGTGGASDETGEACDAGTLSNRVQPVTIDGIASATPTTVSTSGIINGETSYNYGQARRMILGDFDIQRDRTTGSTTATLSARVAWEQILESNTLLGYFVGLEYADSQIDGTFKGDQTRLGLSFGGYAVQRMAEHLYADGYLSMGFGNSDLQMSNGTLALQSDYSSRTITAGAALSGLYAYEQYEFRLELAVNYGRTELGNVGFTGTAYGLTDDTLSLYAGSLTVANLTFRPEILFAVDGGAVAESRTVMSFAPRLICEQTSSTLRADRDDCGGGAEIGFKAQSEDGLSSINFRIAVDEIGNTRRATGNLGAELRF